MNLEEKINSQIKVAMKAKDKIVLESLRAIKSAILLAKTEKGGTHDLSEDAEIKLLQKLVKQRKESAEIYKSQGRDDLYENEMKEMQIIEKFLPEQLSEEKIKEILKGIITETGAKNPSDMGKVMGIASKKLAGKAEGKIIAQLVKQLLSE